MDVVKTSIEKLKGSIEVKSKKGEGSSIIIKLPLTLAIFNGMIIKIGEKKMIVPNSDVIQIINKTKASSCIVDNDNALLRDKDAVYHIVDLEKEIGIKILGKRSKEDNLKKKDNDIYLIATHENKKYALKINEIIDQQKVVLKKLPDNLAKLNGISGATILGDGTVSLILDINKTLSTFSGN